MKKVKFRFITIISLAVLFALVFGLAFGTMSRRTVSAANYEPTAIFAQGTNGDVTAYKATEGEDVKAYTAFRISDGGNVYYRRNLALKWYEGKDDAQYFGMTFKFAELNFETFTITFESAEENVTKEGKATNTLTFTNTDGNLAVSANDGDAVPVTGATDWLVLEFAEKTDTVGAFEVIINDSIDAGTFTNIGGYYLEYRSSAATTPNTPMTFTAKMAEENEDAVQVVLLSELNGQTLEVTGGTAEETDEDGLLKVTGGKVEDNKPAALVLNEKVYAFTLGQKFSLSYQAIDVCDDSVTVTRTYYMYTTDEDGKALDPTDNDNYKTLTTSTYFMPTKDFGDDVDPKDQEIYVSIRIKLNDGSKPSSDDYEPVLLSWYAEGNAIETIGDGEEAFDYIKVNRKQSGPSYVGLEAYKAENAEGENKTSQEFEDAVSAYNTAVEQAAENVSAGSGAYFYLPSLRGLITSASADYRNLKFSIYYYNQTQTESSVAASATSLAYNSLRFAINNEGTYKFRILAVDAAGNGMQYYLDGELVTVTSSNIWKIEEIPEFTFEAKYTGAEIEDAGEQSLGYRDTVYNISSFEVIALDGIEKEYTLYYLDESKLPENTALPSYAEFVANTDKYVEQYRDCFKEINKYNSEITEDDDEWENTDNAYGWDPDASLSFCPQVSGYYIVELLVTDSNRSNEQKTAYQVIDVRNPFDYTPGESQWLQNNVVSIVLFAISAVLLVIIIVLFVVKPSDKKVEEVDLNKLKGKKKNQ